MTADEHVLDVMRSRAGRWFVNDLAEASGYKTDVLYPCLARLEQAGLVESWWQFAGMERRRRYYQITQETV